MVIIRLPCPCNWGCFFSATDRDLEVSATCLSQPSSVLWVSTALTHYRDRGVECQDLLCGGVIVHLMCLGGEPVLGMLECMLLIKAPRPWLAFLQQRNGLIRGASVVDNLGRNLPQYVNGPQKWLLACSCNKLVGVGASLMVLTEHVVIPLNPQVGNRVR